ncbi:flavin reductase [Mycolicibacter heraklionensis]|uniref:Flavin reductase n=1 Tax=Mycolicibacter heraklionensis TaxID=512402 RepID=A0ABR5FK11_9MYCO|nr:flavin reductase family protein [Mycolicibacter heraklionensis]KLO31357.1 flavin reductase [Mycolicibacter heraklionensis]
MSSTQHSTVGVERQRALELMAGVCTPVTIVTTSDDQGPHGATVSSFAGLSLEPPLVTVAFERRSSLLQRILGTGRFGVNLLGHGQDELAMLFARRDADRFAGTPWHYDAGLPRIDGSAGWAACDLYDTMPGGDHLLLVGLVTRTQHAQLPPLIYAHRTFGTHSRHAERPRRPIVDQITACSN